MTPHLTVLTPDLPKQTFTTSFIDEGRSTRVIVVVDSESAEDLQKVIEMGMEQGLTMAQDQLEELFGNSSGS